MASVEDRKYIEETLIPELGFRMEEWAKEYQQPRDLGLRGEFVGLYRKARKLKTILWDGASDTKWREGLRTILFEVVAHALLMLCDYDRQAADEEPDPELAPRPGLEVLKNAGWTGGLFLGDREKRGRGV